MARRLQLTLAILKPDLMTNPVRTQKVKQIILDNSFLIVQAKRTMLRPQDAEAFYGEHEGKFFYNRLVTYMTSGPIKTLVLAREDAITGWRGLMGPTKTHRARLEAPDSIRAMFGISDTRNATHGSDSDSSAKKEISFFFPEFDVEEWHETDEPVFRERRVRYDGLVHRQFDLDNICTHDPVVHTAVPPKSARSGG